jgi:hypothetical protein
MKIKSIIIPLLLLFLPATLEAQLAGFRTNYTYVGNKQSKLVHLTYYHHLPDDFLRENFLTLEDATKANYNKCPICFPEHPMVPGYDFERQLGISTAAILNFYYPVQASAEDIKRVQEAGTRILLNWPLPLKGYNYTFSAVESDMFKAFSCPTGFIYLTTGLLKILESEEELEMVLAHEISHIELRHAFTHSQSQFTAPRMTRDPVAVSMELDELARSLVIVGYEENAEEEADFYAQAYGISRYKEDRGTLILLLNKLRDISWQETRTGGGLFSGNSDLERRIAEISGTRIHVFPRNQEFLSRNIEGEANARAQLILQKLKGNDLTIIAAFWSKETIPLGTAGSGLLRINMSGGELTLPQKEVTFLRKRPDDTNGFHTYLMTFETMATGDDFALNLRNVRSISFDKQQGLRNTRTILSFTR